MTAVEPASADRAPDPRPVVTGGPGGCYVLTGSRCTACGYPIGERLERCPVCHGRCDGASFGPRGVVFAATVLRVPVPEREPPYALAYVDVEDGPRILAHVDRTDGALTPGTVVRLVGRTADGDPLVTPEVPQPRNGDGATV